MEFLRVAQLNQSVAGVECASVMVSDSKNNECALLMHAWRCTTAQCTQFYLGTSHFFSMVVLNCSMDLYVLAVLVEML